MLAVFDASEELNDDDRALMDAIGDTPAVAVINKSDLAPKIDRAEIDKHFKEVVTVSAISGEGLPALQNAAAHALKTAELNPNDGILYTERQRADVPRGAHGVGGSGKRFAYGHDVGRGDGLAGGCHCSFK